MASPRFALLAWGVLVVACSGSPVVASGGAGTGGAGGVDTNFYPAGNGVHVLEAAACDELLAGYDARRQLLNCTGTVPICPSLMRSMSGAPCLLWDEGSIDGCVDFYEEAKTCEALRDHFDRCVPDFVEGSGGSGC
jgi:hypothetical protein